MYIYKGFPCSRAVNILGSNVVILLILLSSPTKLSTLRTWCLSGATAVHFTQNIFHRSLNTPLNVFLSSTITICGSPFVINNPIKGVFAKFSNASSWKNFHQ